MHAMLTLELVSLLGSGIIPGVVAIGLGYLGDQTLHFSQWYGQATDIGSQVGALAANVDNGLIGAIPFLGGFGNLMHLIFNFGLGFSNTYAHQGFSW